MKRYLQVLSAFFCIIALTCFSGCTEKKGKDSNKKEPAKSETVSANSAITGFEAQQSSASDEYTADSAGDVSNMKYAGLVTDSFDGFSGNMSYALHLYDSDYRAANKSESMKSASVIKIFIMEYAYNQVMNEKLDVDTVIGSRKLSSLIESMITYSDNDSTNILIDFFTMDKLNAFFVSQGYNDTVVARRMLDTAAAARGEENYTSAADVMKFLDKLYENQDKYPYNEMLSVMKRQQISTKIRRDMPAGVEIANKTGELSDTDNDVGIIFTEKGDYAFVCLTNGGVSSVARDAIAKSCRAIYDEIMKTENKL
ncbi:MAG: serine hydrolase [Clostridia bacterium]|nr:serine hydrolase [Clostridia bacterium]